MPTPAALVKAARAHADTVVAPGVEGWDEAVAFPRDAALTAAKKGLLGLFAPKEVGGQGLSFAQGMPVFEALGAGDASYAFALSMHNAVAATVGRFAQPAVRDRWGAELTAGR